jgi:signal peptidase
LLVGIPVLAYAADLLLGGDRDHRNRDKSRDTGTNARLLVALFALAVVTAATATMVVPSGPQEFGVVSAESDAPGPRVIETGTSESVPYTLGNGGFVPVVTYFEPTTDGVDVEPRETVIPARSTVNATLTLSAPPETGYYRQYVVEHRYLLLLPQSTIRALYQVHPWLPIAVIDALLGGSFYLLGIAGIGTGRVRTRSRDGPGRLRRLLSRLT